MINWSHPSLDGPPPTYSVGGGRVLKGRCIIAYLHPADGQQLYVTRATKSPSLIGTASSQAEAMLMAIRDHEGGER
jgi:hypothetical protein